MVLMMKVEENSMTRRENKVEEDRIQSPKCKYL